MHDPMKRLLHFITLFIITMMASCVPIEGGLDLDDLDELDLSDVSALFESGEPVCLDDFLVSVGLERDGLDDEALLGALVANLIAGESVISDCRARSDLEQLSPSGGSARFAGSASELGGTLVDAINEGAEAGMEVAVIIDATGSMSDDREAVKSNFDRVLDEVRQRNGKLSVAFYKDNSSCDSDWYTRNRGGLVDADVDELTSFLAGGSVGGGCDWPESAVDAVFKTADELGWSGDQRKIILITDASMLPDERSNHSRAETRALLEDLGVEFEPILVGIAF